MLCSTISNLTAQLRGTLWSQDRPMILTSGTLAVGTDFRRFKEETGLLADGRVTESVSASPFDYRKSRPTARVPEVRMAGRSWFQSVERSWAVISEATAHSMVPPRRSSMA